MKIVVTADCHIQMLPTPKAELSRFMELVLAEKPDVFCVIGDMGDGLAGADPLYRILLGKHPTTFFVLGNHDLYRHPSRKLPPPEAFAINLKHFAAGTPLEHSWDDTETIHTIADCVLVGSIGWPDFDHPLIRDRKTDYDRNVDDWNAATIDHTYIDLTRGWLNFTPPLQKAFAKRLTKAFAQSCATIVVLTHYPIFPGQCVLSPHDLTVWPYFFNWTMGREVLRLARRHPAKRVWCFAGHSHDYCSGKATQEAPNVFAYGHKTDYGQLRYAVFDTQAPSESNPTTIK
jgi:hypothetical protein